MDPKYILIILTYFNFCFCAILSSNNYNNTISSKTNFRAINLTFKNTYESENEIKRFSIGDYSGKDSYSNRKKPVIIGGYNAGKKTSQYISFIDIKFKNGGRSQCTGIVISRDRILTSAHCLVNKKNVEERVDSVYVWVGVRDVRDFQNSSYPYVYKVLTADIDSRYRPNQLNWDISVLTIKGYFPKNQLIAKLASRTLKQEEWVFAAGYGKTRNMRKYKFPRYLQEVKLKARNFGKCTNSLNKLKRKTVNSITMVCASSPIWNNNDKGVCNGDSGGPLFHKLNGMTVYGVTSFRFGDCARKRAGSFYMNISYFRENIRKHFRLKDNIDNIDRSDWNRIM